MTGQRQQQDIGIVSNDPESMYVALSNSTGAPVAVYHDDPNASLTGIWTERTIDLQIFSEQGLNLTEVDRIGMSPFLKAGH